MNTRIKKLRKALDLTQQAFAEKIGLKQNSIALIESGKRNISDQAVLSICREFNVNEEWLRTGSGEMFRAAPSSALDALSEEYGLSNAAYVMVEKFVNLKPEAQETIFNYVLEVAAAFQSGEISPVAPASSLSDILPEKLEELSDEEIGQRYRQAKKIEREVREKSEVS